LFLRILMRELERRLKAFNFSLLFLYSDKRWGKDFTVQLSNFLYCFYMLVYRDSGEPYNISFNFSLLFLPLNSCLKAPVETTFNFSLLFLHAQVVEPLPMTECFQFFSIVSRLKW